MHNPTNILTPARAPARLSGAMAVRTLALTYLTVVLIIPLAVIFYDGLRGGLVGMVRAILQPVALHALLLSLWTAGVMAMINAVMGTLTAYVLVRYSFPGKRLLNGLQPVWQGPGSALYRIPH